jgi:hypothetical protein
MRDLSLTIITPEPIAVPGTRTVTVTARHPRAPQSLLVPAEAM